VDDEQGALETLSSMLQLFCDNVQILGKATSVAEGRFLIKQFHPDLVFLDIRMPFENGFDLLESMEVQEFHVIFTTAYNNYALKAIKFSALDYLLKPINVDELKQAVAKVASSKVDKTQYSVFRAHQLDHNDEQLVLPYKDGFRVVNCREIIRFEGERNYSRAHFLNGDKLLVAKTLKEFENFLSSCNFFRVHQSNIINMNCVKGYKKGRGGTIELINGVEVELARSRKQEFLSRFNSGS